MEEAIVDIALDLNLLPSESAIQAGVQEDMLTNNRDQAQPLTHVQKSSQASGHWPPNRDKRVEALRLSITTGTYHVDSTELAEYIVRSSTHFLETR